MEDQKIQRQKQSKEWFGTWFEDYSPYTEETLAKFKYLVIKKGITPETNKQHWHGIAVFEDSKRGSAVAKLFGNTRNVHIGTVRNMERADKYLMEHEELVLEHSEPVVAKKNLAGKEVTQGGRTDLYQIYDELKQEKTMYQILDAHPATFIRMGRHIAFAKAFLDKERRFEDRKIKVLVLIGEPGSGKTRGVLEHYGRRNVYKFVDTGVATAWFDGYDGEKVLLLDDFYGGIKYNYLLNLLDRYALRLDVKGSTTYAAWETVVITSNAEINTWYTSVPHTIALERRIDVTWKMSDFGKCEWE